LRTRPRGERKHFLVRPAVALWGVEDMAENLAGKGGKRKSRQGVSEGNNHGEGRVSGMIEIAIFLRK